MTTVSPDILKACDIRGTYPKPLGTAQAELIGRAVGSLVKEEPHRNIKVVVGHDVRHSSGALNKALVQGLYQTGLKIVDAGLVSTPLLAYAARYAKASVGIMVTASHNPAEYNGFKFFTDGQPASTDWIQRLYRVLDQQAFRKGAGIIEKKDFYRDYRNALVNAVAQSFQGLKVVVDAGNGAAALTASGVLEALGCQLTLMNGEPDGDYPGRGADSSHPAALAVLGEKVRKTRSQLGVAFDGDGDRISFVDEKGREVPNDIILCLFASDLLKKRKSQKVVYDVKCSDWVDRTVRADGGIPVLERAGHSFIYGRMRSEKAVLGGEASGHFFLPGDFPGDALFACLRLMELLKEEGKTLAQVFDRFPPRVSTHDIKVHLPEDTVAKLYESLKVRAEQLGAKVSVVDGVRAVFEEGWGIVRKSVTEPVVSCRFEAASAKNLKTMVDSWLSGCPEVLQMVSKKIK
jgi:phosphomannomutase/phosphoglucomutase